MNTEAQRKGATLDEGIEIWIGGQLILTGNLLKGNPLT